MEKRRKRERRKKERKKREKFRMMEERMMREEEGAAPDGIHRIPSFHFQLLLCNENGKVKVKNLT